MVNVLCRLLMQKNSYKTIELILLFFLLPVVLAVNILPPFKVGLVLSGVIYCIWISRKLKLISKKDFLQISFSDHWIRILLTFIFIIIGSLLFMYFLHPEDLFIVVKKQPTLWMTILFVYAFFLTFFDP